MTQGAAAGAAPLQDPADRVAAAVLAVPGVAALHPGLFGEVGTYLPGRRVAGIRMADHVIDVHLVVEFGVAVRHTAAEVRAIVGDLHPGAVVNVTVEDIASATTPRRLSD